MRPALQLSMQFALSRDLAQTLRMLLPRSMVRRWIQTSLEYPATLALRWVDEEEGLQLNHHYRKKNYATNVLTFDYQHSPQVQADIIFCHPVVAREAHEQSKSLLAHYAHMVVHGVLHAQGYDHEICEADAEVMETREAKILASLGF